MSTKHATATAPTTADDAASAPTAVAATKVTAAGLGYLPTATPEYADIVERSDRPLSGGDGSFEQRYKDADPERSLLGEGGMGEVRLLADERIGRQIAVKVIRKGHGSRSDLRQRFMREARVQGQLEHPAIVPVYDLGVRADGAAYFTMKRVFGRTLDEILAALKAGDRETVAEISRRKLLDAFARVCQAIEFAHARGVVHRDLKPANVMLGGFGEVYVLDWGVAKLAAVDDPAPAPAHPPVVDGRDGATAAGSVLGTPGYMPPEQLTGEAVDTRADVYALGAILFELLTFEPLHARTDLPTVISSTVKGADARARVRFPSADVPPELEDVCVRATQTRPEARYASVREMTSAIESYLDGDRDLARRRELAAEHATRARDAAARALSSDTAADEANEQRKVAIREVGRALALDQSHVDAAKTLLRLVSTPPASLPEEARARIESARAEGLRYTAIAGTVAYTSWILYVPLIWWMGLRDWPGVAVSAGLMVAAVGLSTAARRLSPGTRHTAIGYTVLVMSCVAISIIGRLASPFVLAPLMVMANVVGWSMRHERKHRVAAACIGAVTMVAPILLEHAGVLAPSYVITNDRIEILPHLVAFTNPQLTEWVLVITMLATLYTMTSFTGWIRDRMARFEHRVQLQAWHFEQLAPDDARPSSAPPPDVLHCLGEVLLKGGTATE